MYNNSVLSFTRTIRIPRLYLRISFQTCPPKNVNFHYFLRRFLIWFVCLFVCCTRSVLLLKVSVRAFANFETPKIRQNLLRKLDLSRLHVYGRPSGRPNDSPSKTLDFAASILRILEHGICIKTLKNASFWSALRVLLGAASLLYTFTPPRSSRFSDY